VEDVRVRADADARLAALDAAEGGAGHAGALGDELGAEAAAQPGEADALAHAGQGTGDSGQGGGGGATHDGAYRSQQVGEMGRIEAIMVGERSGRVAVHRVIGVEGWASGGRCSPSEHLGVVR